MSPRNAGTRSHRWIRYAFLIWAVVSTCWLLNTFRTRDVPPRLLTSDAGVTVVSSSESLAWIPRAPKRSALLFIVGAGVSAEAYAPLLRPIADLGYTTFVVRLPLRIAPLESNKLTALRRAREIIASHPAISRWVVAGHSQGGALASRLAAEPPAGVTHVVLVGTSHPKRFDLSHSNLRFTKVYATSDGVATPEMIDSTRNLLPPSTRWVRIEGGNHSQFGNYGHQLFDGKPSISRAQQQAIVRNALLDALADEGAAGGKS